MALTLRMAPRVVQPISTRRPYPAGVAMTLLRLILVLEGFASVLNFFGADLRRLGSGAAFLV